MLKNKPLIGNSDVGKRLRIIADTMFKTNSALADNLHVSAGVMSKYINGKINPGFGFIKKMYELGFSTSWILNGHGSMFAQNDQGQKLARKYGGESFIPPQKQMLLKLIEEDYGTVLKMCETHSYDFQRINDYLIGDDTETLYFNNCFRDTIPGKKLSAMLANSPSTNEFE
ncbi:MAG: helix-turn-helix transcriptional regulator, partial [Chlorobi bacterium]|nr:helix-turn-helix transcriptional regulator [Chlorobiota bacterium]